MSRGLWTKQMPYDSTSQINASVISFEDAVRIAKSGEGVFSINPNAALELTRARLVKSSCYRFTLFAILLLFAGIATSFFIRWWIFIPCGLAAYLLMIYSNHVAVRDCVSAILRDPELFELVQRRNLLYLDWAQ